MSNVIVDTNIKVPKKKKSVKKIIILSLAAVLLIGGVFVFVRARNADSGDAVEQRTSIVVRGTLIDSITGSAPVISSYRSELSPKVTSTLQQINCEEGDQIKEGDILFVLDNTDALLEIEDTKNSIEQMKLTLNSTAKSVKGLTVSAPFSGLVTNINIKQGDSINKGGALLTITDTSSLKVNLLFNGEGVADIAIGQAAKIYVPDLMVSLEGTVTYKSSKPYTTLTGGDQYNLEITVNNPGSLTEGMVVTGALSVNDLTLESVNSGGLEYVNKSILKSDAGGTVSQINIRENEYVDAGETLIKLENDDLLLTTSTNDIKMDNLQSQLEIKEKQLGYYTIVAPFDGTITKMGSANEGDTVKQGDTLAILSDMSHLEFSISIDELDISQIEVGQQVEITAEALEETEAEPLTGKVSKVAMEGTSSNGVTTYPVTVAVDENAAGKLKTGMNIDAEIFISNKSDVLMVPVEAVTKIGDKSFVYVKSATGEGQTGQGEQTDSVSRAYQAGQSPSTEQGLPAMSEGMERPDRSRGKASTDASGEGTSGADTRNGAPGMPAQNNAGSSDMPAQGASSQTRNFSGQRAGAQGSSSRMAGRKNTESYYDGATMVLVETGISNDTYIEIISGLTEGQVIVLPKTSTASAMTTTNEQGVRKGGGFMSGGMPSGGMPSGGPGGF